MAFIALLACMSLGFKPSQTVSLHLEGIYSEGEFRRNDGRDQNRVARGTKVVVVRETLPKDHAPLDHFVYTAVHEKSRRIGVL